TLVTLFMLLSFAYYIKNVEKNDASSYIAMLACFTLALLSRENALILPLLLLLYHIAFKIEIKRIAFIPIAAMALIYITFRVFIFKFKLPHVVCPATLAERIPGFFIAMANYTRLLFLPLGLHMEYGTKIFPWSHPLVPIGALICVGIIALTFYYRKRDGLVFFSLCWFILALIPSSNIYPINAYMAEHWLYIPSIGFFIIIARILRMLYVKKSFKIVSIASTAVLIIFLTVLTIQNNRYWQNGITLYERTLKYAPDRAVLYNNLGILYADRGDTQEAIELFKKAVQLDPSYVYAYNNLGKAYNMIGNKKEAMDYYKKALELYPDSVESLYNIGNIYLDFDQPEKAIEQYKQAIKISPYYTKAYYNMGNAYRRIGKPEEAVPQYLNALKYNPDYFEVYNNLALTYHEMGRSEEALRILREAVTLKPDFALAYSNLAVVYHNTGQDELAVENFLKAKSLGFRNALLEKELEQYLPKE
ncbi:MAG: tetratricopeptide repeat protein, partial [Candidatus Omnitrophica bacterium]|nr:tetratricopeptide repeat protein [Candidatus Omnitrophota bacterium]